MLSDRPDRCKRGGRKNSRSETARPVRWSNLLGRLRFTSDPPINCTQTKAPSDGKGGEQVPVLRPGEQSSDEASNASHKRQHAPEGPITVWHNLGFSL